MVFLLSAWLTWDNILGVPFLAFAFFMLTFVKAKNLRDRRKRQE
jgi:hypothetical protein